MTYKAQNSIIKTVKEDKCKAPRAGADQEGKMIRVNGWTNHMEKIGKQGIPCFCRQPIKTILLRFTTGAEIFPSQTVTFGDLGKVESFLNEEARKAEMRDISAVHMNGEEVRNEEVI